jgi:putative membrane protein
VVAEHRLHPAYLILGTGRAVRSLIPVIAIAVWKAPWWTWVVLGMLVLLGAVAGWWTRTYQVADSVLRVRSGVLHRTVTTVPIPRITALETERGLVQRVLGVSALHVQTPGDGEHSSVHLSCLSAARLTELRAALSPDAAGMARRPTESETSPDPDALDPPPAVAGAGAVRLRNTLRRHWNGEAAPSGDVRVIAVVGTRELLIAAVTGVSVPIIVGGGLVAWGRAQDYLPRAQREWLEHAVFGRGLATVLVLLGLLLVAVMVGVVSTSLRLARFTLLRDGDRLRTTRGLLSQRTGSVAVDRIQAVRLVEGFWRRRFGLCEVLLEVAGVGGPSSAGRVMFPVVAMSRVSALLAAALPELPAAPTLLTPTPSRARRRFFTRPMWVAAAATVLAALLPGWWALLAVLPFPLAIWVALGRARDAGWSVGPELSVFRWRRLLARHTVIARTARVQLTTQHTGWFSYRAGLRGLRIALSSRRTAGAAYLERSDADRALHLIGRRRSA